MTFTHDEFKKISDQARAAGSYQAIEPVDITFDAQTNDMGLTVAAFGCKLTISDVVSQSAESADVATIKVPFKVTGEPFVEIDGVPYLSRGLL